MPGSARDFPGLLLLDMVGVLHRRGHERLRAVPAMAASGVHWRLTLGTIDRAVEPARYSTGSGAEYFGWRDTAGLGPEGLADLFVVHFPVLSAAALGADPDYAAWFRRLLELAEQGWIPYFYADWPDPVSGSVPLFPLDRTDAEPPVLPDPPGGR